MFVEMTWHVTFKWLFRLRLVILCDRPSIFGQVLIVSYHIAVFPDHPSLIYADLWFLEGSSEFNFFLFVEEKNLIIVENKLRLALSKEIGIAFFDLIQLERWKNMLTTNDVLAVLKA